MPLNVSKEEWEVANCLLEGKSEGTKLKHLEKVTKNFNIAFCTLGEGESIKTFTLDQIPSHESWRLWINEEDQSQEPKKQEKKKKEASRKIEIESAKVILREAENGKFAPYKVQYKVKSASGLVEKETILDKESLTRKDKKSFIDIDKPSYALSLENKKDVEIKLLRHSFILADNMTWAMPNYQEKVAALKGKGVYGKVYSSESEQKSLYNQDGKSIEEHRQSKKAAIKIQRQQYAQQAINENEVALDIRLAFVTVEKSYLENYEGSHKGDSIIVMKDLGESLEKKYEGLPIPVPVAINTLQELVKFHSGELSKTDTKYLHRDIKLSNILIDVEGKVSLCDVGNSIAQDQIDDKCVGSTLFIAPEVINNVLSVVKSQLEGDARGKKPTSIKYSVSNDLYALVKSLMLHELQLHFKSKYIDMLRQSKDTLIKSKACESFSPVALQLVSGYIHAQYFNEINNKYLEGLLAKKCESSNYRYLSNPVLVDVLLKPTDQRPSIVEVIAALYSVSPQDCGDLIIGAKVDDQSFRKLVLDSAKEALKLFQGKGWGDYYGYVCGNYFKRKSAVEEVIKRLNGEGENITAWEAFHLLCDADGSNWNIEGYPSFNAIFMDVMLKKLTGIEIENQHISFLSVAKETYQLTPQLPPKVQSEPVMLVYSAGKKDGAQSTTCFEAMT